MTRRPARGRRPRRASEARPLGHRLREVRAELKLTLKDVETTSGFSATHISEIERDRTSPTIGVLLRIASALGKDPAFFLDDERRGASSQRQGSLPGAVAGVQRTTVTPLSSGVAGGALVARRVDLPPGGRSELDAREETCGFVAEGRVTLEAGGRAWQLERGDAFHRPAGDRCVLRAGTPDACSLLLVGAQPSSE